MENNKKVVCIYSVGTNGYGINKFEDGKQGIYIYENSKELLSGENKISVGDIIIFLRTGAQKLFLFEIKNENQIIKEYSNGNSYIIMEDEEEFVISIEQFKNLYFLNFDSLASWVRSPLSTKKNILVFNNKEEIITEFKSFDKLKEVFNNVEDYLRKYYFTKNKNDIETFFKSKNYKNIVTYIENDRFVKEYSYFYQNGNEKITNFGINFDKLENKYKSQNKKKLKFIRENESVYYTTYPSYYDLTRVDQNYGNTNEYEKEIIEEEIKNINTEIEQTKDENKKVELENRKQEFTYEKESIEDIEKEIENDMGNTTIETQEKENFMEIKKSIDFYVVKEIKKLNTIKNKESIENKLNTLLPMIRLSYIYQWGLNSGKSFENINLIIQNFDEILKKSQEREQKQSAFKLLFLFFVVETILLFLIIGLVGLGKLDISDTTLQILTGATILQVGSMLTFVVLHLYPKKDDKNN